MTNAGLMATFNTSKARTGMMSYGLVARLLIRQQGFCGCSADSGLVFSHVVGNFPNQQDVLICFRPT